MSAATSIATARRLLAKYGDAVTLTYETGAVIDPATGEVDVHHPGTTDAVTGNGYPARYRANEADGVNIIAGDVRLILEQVAMRPDVGWRADVDGKTYRVMTVQTIRKSGDDVIYICQLRAT